MTVSGANDGSFDPEHWWQSRLGVKEMTREWAGMVVAMWELRGGAKEFASAPSRCGPVRTKTAISGIEQDVTPHI